MPVRKIPKSYIGVTGYFASTKNGRVLGFESLLERDYMILLEFDPEIERFEEQPVIVPVTTKGRRATTYVPDILVHFRPAKTGQSKKPVLVEVKKRRDLEKNKEKYAAKFASAKRYASDQGWVFRTVSEEDIRKPCLPNLKFLREYRLIDPAPGDIARVLDALKTQGGNSDLSTLLDCLESTDAGRLHILPVIWHLVATGRLTVDIDQPFTDQTPIALPQKGKR